MVRVGTCVQDWALPGDAAPGCSQRWGDGEEVGYGTGRHGVLSMHTLRTCIHWLLLTQSYRGVDT